jgi:glycosyltransferase involved in cell wall biosynthesis
MLRSLGHDVTVFAPGEQANFPVTIFESPRSRRVTLEVDDIGCDVLVMQRPLDWKWQHVIPQFRALGVKVVVDLDDDIAALRPNHAVYWVNQPSRNPDQNHHHLMRAMQQADMVTVSTPALARKYGRAGHVTVIPNCVPERYLSLPRERHERTVVGWTGAVATHPDDLNVMGYALQEVGRSHDFEWRVVGDSLGVRAVTSVEPVHVPWVPIHDYAAEVAKFDVGVVPLALHAFNEAKSWLKGLEMSSVGVPFVASPTAPYKNLIAQGAGLLAESNRPKQWSAALKRLLTDRVLYGEMSEAGREVARQWTFESNAWRWEEVWLCPN